MTARTNDEGWATIFAEWLKGSRLNAKDGVLIFSVGGGDIEKNVSPNLVTAIQLAKKIGDLKTPYKDLEKELVKRIDELLRL